MAIKTVLVDDIDGSEGAESVYFSYNGTQYEIDLVAANVKKLDAALLPFVSAARKRGHKRRAGVIKVTKPTGANDLNAIRDWANKKGMKVSDRGRIPRDVVDAFNAEHDSKGSGEPQFSAAASA